MSKRDGVQTRRNSDGTTSYRAQVRVRGYRLSETFPRKTDAKAWIDETKTKIRTNSLASTEAAATTLKQALERYLREPPKKKDGKPLKGWKRQQDRVRAWIKHPLALRYLSDLRGPDFAAYVDKRRAEGRAENTIRLALALISKVYKIAATKWNMQGLSNPIDGVEKPGGSNVRKRRLQDDEEARLLSALAAEGPYMVPLASLAIESAMRQGELLALTWADVDLVRRIAYLKDTKNSEPRDVPLSSKAVEIIKAMPRPLTSPAPLFPLTQDEVIKTFRRACVTAKIEGLRFHDLRREAVSRLFERGLNLAEVAAISGHKTWSQLKRYTELKAEDLAKKLA